MSVMRASSLMKKRNKVITTNLIVIVILPEIISLVMGKLTN